MEDPQCYETLCSFLSKLVLFFLLVELKWEEKLDSTAETLSSQTRMDGNRNPKMDFSRQVYKIKGWTKKGAEVSPNIFQAKDRIKLR